MNPLRIACLFMGILGLASAGRDPRTLMRHRNNLKDSLKPSDWMSLSELESLPSLQEMTIGKLEEMTLLEGAEWAQKMYHMSQAGRAFESSYAPKASEIPAYLIKPNNKKVTFRLSELTKMSEEDMNIGNEEVTILITGLPEKSETIKKANRKLVEAYMQRYNGQALKPDYIKYEDDNSEKRRRSSSEENEEDSFKRDDNKPTGTLIVIELGNMLEDMRKYATLDVEQTGMNIGNVLVKWTDKTNIPHEIVHVMGSNIGAHIAGAVGRQFTRETGHKLRRITGLDPSHIFAQTEKALRGLARGDADFVDVIHTSALGLGTPIRSGDADFYPNGPSEGVPGADNVVEASMRALRYFAESVLPGNERNFPAVGATSWKNYKENHGNGKRVYMGIDTDYDVEGDFMLQVNAKSPFGRSSPAERQENYHIVHKPWKTNSRDD